MKTAPRGKELIVISRYYFGKSRIYRPQVSYREIEYCSTRASNYSKPEFEDIVDIAFRLQPPEPSMPDI